MSGDVRARRCLLVVGSTVAAIAAAISLVLGAATEVQAGEAPPLETVAVVDTFGPLPPCCAIPRAVVARGALRASPGVVEITEDEATGYLVVRFDPRRAGRARIIEALKEHGFQPVAPKHEDGTRERPGIGRRPLLW